MKTLFAKFLLWFWLGLAVLLGAEILLETHSLEQGLAVHSERAEGPFALYADLARETLADRGVAGLDSLIDRLGRNGGYEAFRIDSAGSVSAPVDARGAGLAALRARRSMLTETDEGFFIAYPVGRAGGNAIALVVHPVRGGRGHDGAGADRGERHWPPFLPIDLTVRGLATLALGGLGCYLLARYITAPVIRLRQATQRLADGDLGARVGSENRRRRDELEDLGRDFDRMASRLETLGGAQRRLLSDMSHELRSPLARMNVALGLLRQREGDDRDGMIARLEAETARLNLLIGDVLALSRAEAGEPVPEYQRVDLGALAEEIAADARFEGGTRVREVRLTRTGTVTVMGAPGLLRSALENVVRNAVRHTREGTTIEIRVEPRGAEAVVEVRDHGPGVPADQLERIFEPFYRVEGAPTRPPGGTGLGLAIARRVMARHGGGITASLPEDGGLRVTIRLPAAPAA